MASGMERENDGGIAPTNDPGSEEGETGVGAQQQDLILGSVVTTTPPLLVGNPPLPTAAPLATLPEADTTNGRPSSDSQSDMPPASQPQAFGHPIQDQVIQDLEAPSQPDRNTCHRATTTNLLTSFDDLPMNARESGWMKSKKTLKYFREAYKLDKLPDLILHWYQLEEALGFPETVSYLAV